MHEFTAKYADQIAGSLSGFDRLVFRGTLRQIAHAFGMKGYLWANQVLLQDFGKYVEKISAQVKAGAVEARAAARRPVQYQASSQTNKEEVARAIAARDQVEEGPVCALTCVEPCWSYDVHRNGQTKQLELVQRLRKCLFVYQYWKNARIQTWFPFSIQVCVNGREWLAQQLRQAGMRYQKQDNCLVWVEDWQKAQALVF